MEFKVTVYGGGGRRGLSSSCGGLGTVGDSLAACGEFLWMLPYIDYLQVPNIFYGMADVSNAYLLPLSKHSSIFRVRNTNCWERHYIFIGKCGWGLSWCSDGLVVA